MFFITWSKERRDAIFVLCDGFDMLKTLLQVVACIGMANAHLLHQTSDLQYDYVVKVAELGN